MSLFYGNIFSFYKMPSHKRSTDAVGVFFYIPNINRKPENPSYTHSRIFQNELSKRSYFTFTGFAAVKLVPSLGGLSLKWSVPATQESSPSSKGSQLIASVSFCILGYVSVVQYSKNCEYPATLSLWLGMPALLLITCMLPML